MKKIFSFIFLIFVCFMLVGCSTNNGIIMNDMQTIAIGEKKLLSINTVTDSDIVWESSNTDIASVDEYGVVTGYKGGIVTITATVGNDVYKIMIAVEEKDSNAYITLSANQTIYVNETTQINARVNNIDKEPTIVYYSSDEKIATVDENGLVTGKSIGLVTITARTLTDKVIEQNIVILVRSKTNILQDIDNYIESHSYTIEGDFDLSELSNTIVGVIEKNYPAIVGVSNYIVYPGSGLSQLNSLGTGFIYKREDYEGRYLYYVLTNYHVVAGNNGLKVYFGEKDLEITANIRMSSQSLDLAIVVFFYEEKIEPVTFGNIEDLKPGQFVLTLGHPVSYDYFGTATFGMISYVNRKLEDEMSNFIQHDAAINPGNSGGPLFNMKGEVIGINTIKLADTDIDNISFAIAIDTIKNFLKAANLE